MLFLNFNVWSKIQFSPSIQLKLHANYSFKFQESERIDFSFNPYYEPEFKWFDKELLNAVRSDEENAHNFFRLLALCHTVMPDQKEGKLEYQAQSPDEAALVSAARNFGFVFKSRTPNSISIEVKGKLEVSELCEKIYRHLSMT